MTSRSPEYLASLLLYVAADSVAANS